jgi:hypothetical protein
MHSWARTGATEGPENDRDQLDPSLGQIRSRAQRLIEDHLDAAGHRADLEGPLFRPVKNNSTGLLAKPLNPQSLYESIVLHYAKKVTGRILK